MSNVIWILLLLFVANATIVVEGSNGIRTGNVYKQHDPILVNTIEFKFSYSVNWYKETLEWKDGHSRYWLSIIQSFVLVMLLTAFLRFLILRIKHDFSRDMKLPVGDDISEGKEVR